MADAVDQCDAVSGIAVPHNNEVTQFTEFLNEACDQVSIRQNGKLVPSEMFSDVHNVQDPAEYFSRPILISTLNYAGNRGPLATYDITNAWIQANMYNFARVKGAFGYRATVCFRLQVIANPFQAGILKMAFSPFQDSSFALGFDRTTSIAAVSQLPGVMLDITEATSCILKIPFIHVNNYFSVVAPLASDVETLGKLVVFNYSPPVLAVGASNPTLPLWAWLEDFELIGATAAEFVVQSGKFSKKNTSSKEADAIPGNLSNVLSAGSNFVTWAGTRVPMISSFSGPTSWFMRQAAHIAASYGWSRPLDVQPTSKMYQTCNVYQNNSDGPDPSLNLGLFSDNAVAPLPGFAGTSLDEMSFDYIKSVFCAISVGTLSTADTIGLLKKSVQLTPSALFFTLNTNLRSPNLTIPTSSTGKSFWPSVPFAMANTFQLWRGGFRFRVRIAKTKFHTGRLILGFAPNNTAASNTTSRLPTNMTNMQFQSMVWDLRETNVVEFDCPFVSYQSYLQFLSNYGTFFITVLDPLDGPSTVSQTVNFIVEVAAMQDFEVAAYEKPLFPVSPADTIFTAQSGSFNSPPSDTPSLYCIGEKVNSVKQCIARAGVAAVLQSSGFTIIDATYSSSFWLPNSAAPTSLNPVRSFPLNYWQPFYAMSRGGYHVHAVPTSKGCTITASTSLNDLSGTSFIIENDGPLHVKAPYFHERSRGLVLGTFDSEVVLNPTIITFSKPAGSAADLIVSVRAADDFQLGYFVGAPPLCYPFDYSTPDDLLLQNILTTDR